jgi:hypothetical protein
MLDAHPMHVEFTGAVFTRRSTVFYLENAENLLIFFVEVWDIYAFFQSQAIKMIMISTLLHDWVIPSTLLLR